MTSIRFKPKSYYITEHNIGDNGRCNVCKQAFVIGDAAALFPMSKEYPFRVGVLWSPEADVVWRREAKPAHWVCVEAEVRGSTIDADFEVLRVGPRQLAGTCP